MAIAKLAADHNDSLTAMPAYCYAILTSLLPQSHACEFCRCWALHGARCYDVVVSSQLELLLETFGAFLVIMNNVITPASTSIVMRSHDGRAHQQCLQCHQPSELLHERATAHSMYREQQYQPGHHSGHAAGAQWKG